MLKFALLLHLCSKFYKLAAGFDELTALTKAKQSAKDSSIIHDLDQIALFFDALNKTKISIDTLAQKRDIDKFKYNCDSISDLLNTVINSNDYLNDNVAYFIDEIDSQSNKIKDIIWNGLSEIEQDNYASESALGEMTADEIIELKQNLEENEDILGNATELNQAKKELNEFKNYIPEISQSGREYSEIEKKEKNKVREKVDKKYESKKAASLAWWHRKINPLGHKRLPHEPMTDYHIKYNEQRRQNRSNRRQLPPLSGDKEKLLTMPLEEAKEYMRDWRLVLKSWEDQFEFLKPAEKERYQLDRINYERSLHDMALRTMKEYKRPNRTDEALKKKKEQNKQYSKTYNKIYNRTDEALKKKKEQEKAWREKKKQERLEALKKLREV